jgi:selenocysteine lyase/cysteine desulfurase
MLTYLEHEALLGGYEAEDEAAERIAAVYGHLAELLGTRAENVALVENATVGFSQALSAFAFEPGDRIVTTRSDYPSNQTMYRSLAERLGVGEAVRYALEVGEAGFTRARALAARIRERIAELPGYLLRDPFREGRELSAIVTVESLGGSAEDLQLALRKRRINTSVSRRRERLFDPEAPGATSVLRISPHYYNS